MFLLAITLHSSLERRAASTESPYSSMSGGSNSAFGIMLHFHSPHILQFARKKQLQEIEGIRLPQLS